MPRSRHPKKQVEVALRAAERCGLVVESTRSGHRWGYVRCPWCTGPALSVWSTPRVPENLAAQVVQFIRRHEHREEEG